MLCFTASKTQIVPGIAIQTAGRERPYVRAGEHLITLSDELILLGGSVLGAGGRLLRAAARRAQHDDKQFELVPETEAVNASALVLWHVPQLYNVKEASAEEIIVGGTNVYTTLNVGQHFDETMLVSLPIGSTLGFYDVHLVRKATQRRARGLEHIFGVPPQYDRVRKDYRTMAAFDGQRLNYTKEWLSSAPW